MRLFTFMPLQAYKDTLEKAGRYVCYYSKTSNDEGDVEDNFAPAYINAEFFEKHGMVFELTMPGTCVGSTDVKYFSTKMNIARTANQRELECLRARLLKTSTPGPQRVRGISLAKNSQIW